MQKEMFGWSQQKCCCLQFCVQKPAGDELCSHDSILESMLFKVFIIDIDSEIEWTLSKFVYYAKLSSTVDMIERRDAI